MEDKLEDELEDNLEDSWMINWRFIRRINEVNTLRLVTALLIYHNLTDLTADQSRIIYPLKNGSVSQSLRCFISVD